MQAAALTIGIIAFVAGISLGIYRIKNYSNRLDNPHVFFRPGYPPGTLGDKFFYIGTAFLFAAGGLLFVVEAFTGFAE